MPSARVYPKESDKYPGTFDNFSHLKKILTIIEFKILNIFLNLKTRFLILKKRSL